jgi:hypothetical protein
MFTRKQIALFSLRIAQLVLLKQCVVGVLLHNSVWKEVRLGQKLDIVLDKLGISESLLALVVS